MLAANAACEYLLQSAIFMRSQHIACYVSVKSEFDTMPILQAIHAEQKNCYLPKLTDENLLRFVTYSPQTKMQLNAYGIPEPESTAQIAIDQLDLIMMPLVAFDHAGYRLGAGGGYYDRTLAACISANVRPFFLGIGFACQQTDSLPHDVWDIKLDAILTEEGYREF